MSKVRLRAVFGSPKSLFKESRTGTALPVQVYSSYPQGQGIVIHQEQLDFNAEPPWDPS
ncbi:hypothetical protein JZ751_000355 [Albula glossodonta]|uniref:Uncharacterized protein n=1 Tax=Albula glossodonta TaxID=121402 RepID=A0A8T2PVN6_9TELE|nr:hypothetical protein JZ751_000355 [Albula glossodonta]